MKYLVDNDLHIHSHLSTCSRDEEQTTERILKYAQGNDLKTICVTDHFWDDDVSGADEWYRRQNFEHISQSKPLPKADGIRFLFGCEAELSKDLKISIPRERFEDFDLVLISTTHFHKVGLTITEEEAATTESRVNTWIKRLDAVLNMDIPFEKVGLAHLTCGVIGIGGYENHINFMDMLPEDELYRLFKKASQLKVGIELNRNDFKFDEKGANSILKPYRIAKECGCKFYLGSDAHHPQAFEEAKDYFEFAVNILELTEDDKFII